MSFIDAHDFPVGLVLRVLGIPASTYYDWRARRTNPGRAAREDAELLGMIVKIRGEHEFAATYGSPRVWLELRRHGVRVGAQARGADHAHQRPQGAHLRRGWKRGSTRQNPRHTAAPDLVGRDFRATAPNTKWVADLTRILTGEGVLWLASVRDAFANKVVGWASGPARDHRAGAHGARLRDLVPRRPRRAADPPQRQGLSIHRRCGSPNDWSTPASRPRPAASGIASITPSRRTCGRPSRSS